MNRSDSQPPSPAAPSGTHRGAAAALVVFAISMLSVFLAWRLVNQDIENEAGLRMEHRVEQVRAAIANRLQGYEQVLRGGAGLLAASESVERREWHEYVESLKIHQHYPGIQGIGFAKRVLGPGIAAHVRAIRAEGFSAYNVRPEGKRDEYYPVIYLEPFRERNLRAFGFDMFPEPVRRAAMARARDTGETSVSGKVRLVQETEVEAQAGFLMYIPVYKNGAPRHMVGERRKNIIGFVYSPFRMDDLMAGILGQAKPDLDMEIYDGPEAIPSALMYDDHKDHTHPSAFRRTARLEMGGVVWTLTISSLPPFEEQFDTGLPALVLAGGFFVSLLLATITWSVSTTGQRAQALADRMTAELRHSEERFRLLVQSSPFCIHEIDMEGRLQSMNRAGLDMMGLKEEQQVCGMEYLAAVGEPDKTRIGDLLQRAFQGESSHFEFVSAGNNPLYFKSCFVPIKDHRGNVLKMMGITEDITERTKAAEAIARSEERYRLLVEGGLVIAWELDLATWLFTYVSPYAEQVLGYAQAEWYRPNFWVDHLHPDDRDFALNYCVASTKMGRDHTFEYRMIAKDGRVLWFRDLVSVIKGADGKPVSLRGFLLDITERKQAEDGLKKAKELAEEATRTKDKFISLVAHDLRTPLASIVGFGKLLTAGSLPPKEAQLAGMMVSSGENAVRLIDELLTVSRLHLGSIEIRRSFVDGYLLTTMAIMKVSYLAEEKGISIQNHVPLGTRLYADPNLFGEVLLNTLSNAIKFTRQGGTVALFLPPGEGTTLAVQDTGTGIIPNVLPKLFKYEEKTSTLGTAGEIGTGLGLPLSHEIMLAHGGAIRVESEPGKGSTFFLSLPAVRPVLLVVEDEGAVRYLMKEYLREVDLEILEAENGRQALATLEEREVHLVLTDLKMPVMDGFDLLETVKKNPRTAKTPVIVITSSSDQKTRQRAFNLGAEDYVTKPLNPEDLIPRVRKVLI